MNFLKLNQGWLFVNPLAITKVEKGENQIVLTLTNGSSHVITDPADITALLAVVSPKAEAPEPMYFKENGAKPVKKAGK